MIEATCLTHKCLQVHGNASADNTNNNAARCLYAFAAPEHIRVCPGANKPLIRPERHDPEIHGLDGLGGVEGLPRADSEGVRARLVANGTPIRALEGMAKAISETWKNGTGNKVTIVSSGPMTNVALFVSVYPDLLDGIGKFVNTPRSFGSLGSLSISEEFVFMGGGVGIGNRSASAGQSYNGGVHRTQTDTTV